MSAPDDSSMKRCIKVSLKGEITRKLISNKQRNNAYDLRRGFCLVKRNHKFSDKVIFKCPFLQINIINILNFQDLETYNVKQLVRSCEKTYEEDLLNKAGIKVNELVFPDGQLPEQATIDEWLKIVDDFFEDALKNNENKIVTDSLEQKSQKTTKRRHSKMIESGGTHGSHPKRIGVHCVAGLGRAPLLVALALVHKGCSRINAIELIRSKRPGSLNMVQANFLAVEYKDKNKKQNSNASCKCSIF